MANSTDKPADKARVRIQIKDNGEILLWVGELSETISESGVDNLINMLATAKADSKEIQTAYKKIRAITKNYNSVGKPLEDSKLKIVADGAGVPEGVIDADRI